MTIRTSIAIVCIALLAIPCAQVAAQDDEVSLIAPAGQRLLHLHSQRFIRTPDGVLWDMWGEQEYLKVFNRVVKKRAIKEKRTTPILAEYVTIGHRWEIEDTRDAIAWGVTTGNRAPPQWYWTRESDGTPPLWHTTTPSARRFIYINERERNAVAEDEDTRSTKVIADLGANLYKIEINRGRGIAPRGRDMPSRLEGNAIVHIPKPAGVIRNGWLSGEFILWPDDDMIVPAGVKEEKYVYLAINELRPTIEELGAAVLTDKAELVTWTYRREAGAWRWVRRTSPLELINKDEIDARRQRAAERAAAEESLPAIERTHLLVLKNGDYLYGRLLEESEREVRFLVVVGSIGAERRFPREDIGRLVELSEDR